MRESAGLPRSSFCDQNSDLTFRTGDTDLTRDWIIRALPGAVALAAAAFLVLYVMSTRNYLFYHSIAELFSVVIAYSVFTFAWNARQHLQQNFLVLIGIAYLFVGGMDMLHTFAYQGMDIFRQQDANLPTQLWLAARYLTALAWLWGALAVGRRVDPVLTFTSFTVLSALLIFSIFGSNIFPDAYVTPGGLTPFKIISEYVISLALLAALIVLVVRRRELDRTLLWLLVGSLAFSIVSELMFTLYIGVYDFFNFLGHYLKIIAVYLLYMAVIEGGLTRPFSILFRDLQQSRKELAEERSLLEERVHARTAELEERNEQLMREIALREQATAALQESEARYRQLIDSAASAIIRLKTDGTITFLNEFAERLFGWTAEEAVGKPITILLPEFETSGRPLEGLVRRVVEDPEGYATFENENITRDGRRIWMAWSNRPIYDSEGELAEIMTIGQDRTVQHQAEQELVDNQERLRRLASELVLAEERERRRIATEIHDNLSQTLAFARMKLSAILSQAPEEQKPDLGQLQELLESAVADTRSVTFELSPPVLYTMGLAAAVEWLARHLAERHGLAVHLQKPDTPSRLTEEARTIVFQAVREIFNNMIKHAQAANAYVDIAEVDGRLQVQVRDDGVGFDPAKAKWSAEQTSGFGLFNIRERLQQLGGEMEIDSAPGRGTTIRLRVPLAGENGAPV